MSTHNLCFRANIRKNVYPYTPQFYYIKVGCKGVLNTWACYPDVNIFCFEQTQEGSSHARTCTHNLCFEQTEIVKSNLNWHVNVTR